MLTHACYCTPYTLLQLILRNGEPAGYVRRAGYSYTTGKPIAIGYVYGPQAAAGERESISVKYVSSGSYEIETLGRRLPATRHAKCIVDPANRRIQGIYDDDDA